MPHMHWACSMGHVVHGDGEDEIVKAAQDHMRKEHGMEVSREDVLKDAHTHQH